FLVVLLEPRPLSSFTLSRIEHEVDRQPVQPGRERALATKEVQLLPRTNEDVLRQLLGTLTVGDHSRAEGEHASDMFAIEPLERTPVSGRRACDVRISVSDVTGRCFDDGHCSHVAGSSLRAGIWTVGDGGRFERGGAVERWSG